MKSTLSRSAALVAALTLLAATSGPSAGDDWPQWRGPDRDGRSSFTDLLAPWPADGPPVLWRAALGGGYSGMAVVDGRLVTMSGGDASRLVAFEADSGEEIWSARVDHPFRNGQGDGPRGTPTIDGERVFALSAHGTLAAHDVRDGRALWSVDFADAYGASPPTWGFSTSPIVDGPRLLIEVGGGSGAAIVALDKTDGHELWRSQGDNAGYSAPIIAELDGVRTAVFFTGERVVGVRPESGVALWSTPWTTAYGVNAATPVLVPPDRIFVSSGYDVGSALFEIDGSEVSTIWRNREMKNLFSTSVHFDGYIYGFDNSVLECIDVNTGERMWRTRGFGHGSLLYADAHLIVLGESGQLALVEATPAAFRERSRAQALSGKTWTMPSLANGILYVRSERALAALDLRDPRS